MNSPRFLTAQEVGDLLNIADKTVYRLKDEGTLPHYRFGRSVRFAESDVLEFVSRNRVEI